MLQSEETVTPARSDRGGSLSFIKSDVGCSGLIECGIRVAELGEGSVVARPHRRKRRGRPIDFGDQQRARQILDHPSPACRIRTRTRTARSQSGIRAAPISTRKRETMALPDTSPDDSLYRQGGTASVSRLRTMTTCHCGPSRAYGPFRSAQSAMDSRGSDDPRGFGRRIGRRRCEIGTPGEPRA